jgi:hypothetical protein
MIFSCGQNKKKEKILIRFQGWYLFMRFFLPFIISIFLERVPTGPHRQAIRKTRKLSDSQLPKKNLSVSSSHSFGRLLLLPSLSLSPSLFFSNGLRYQASTDSDSDWPHRYKTSVLFFLFAVSSLFFFFFSVSILSHGFLVCIVSPVYLCFKILSFLVIFSPRNKTTKLLKKSVGNFCVCCGCVCVYFRQYRSQTRTIETL